LAPFGLRDFTRGIPRGPQAVDWRHRRRSQRKSESISGPQFFDYAPFTLGIGNPRGRRDRNRFQRFSCSSRSLRDTRRSADDSHIENSCRSTDRVSSNRRPRGPLRPASWWRWIFSALSLSNDALAAEPNQSHGAAPVHVLLP